MKLFKKEENTRAQLERGVGILNSLKVVINVLYALLIFQAFLILPRPDDPDLKYFSLAQIFSDNILKLVVIVVGLILMITYWIQTNRQIGNLVRSSPTHATLAIVQMICLMLYLYFVRFDMEFDGMTLALQMESVFLALAGFIGVYNWIYARKNNLTSDQINDNEERTILFQILPEPLAALFSLPFATISPSAWTLSFLIIIPLAYSLKILRKRRESKITEKKIKIMTSEPETSKSKLILGGIILVVGFMSPLVIPFVVESDLPISYKKILSGLLAFGIPELFIIIAVAVMGKQGYEFIKEKVLKYLKRIVPSDSVSLIRYRIGLILFSVPIIIGIAQPYLAYYIPFFKELPLWWYITSDIMFVSSFFVLGGDFWDKLSGLFKHNVKVFKELN